MFAARCLQSAVREDLISRPTRCATVRGGLPILLSVACLSITFQDLSVIHWLAGCSLAGGGGLHQDVTPRMRSLALYGVPRGYRVGNANIAADTLSSPSPPLHEFWQQERNG